MPRASDMLIVLTYAMIAIVAALAFERFGLMSTSFAWMMGAVVFLIASQAHSAAARSIERSEMIFFRLSWIWPLTLGIASIGAINAVAVKAGGHHAVVPEHDDPTVRQPDWKRGRIRRVKE